jgi:hypothetical protein
MCGIPDEFEVSLRELSLLNEELDELQASHDQLDVRVTIAKDDLHHVHLSDPLQHVHLVQPPMHILIVVVSGRWLDLSVDLVKSGDPLLKLLRL